MTFSLTKWRYPLPFFSRIEEPILADSSGDDNNSNCSNKNYYSNNNYNNNNYSSNNYSNNNYSNNNYNNNCSNNYYNTINDNCKSSNSSSSQAAISKKFSTKQQNRKSLAQNYFSSNFNFGGNEKLPIPSNPSFLLDEAILARVAPMAAIEQTVEESFRHQLDEVCDSGCSQM